MPSARRWILGSAALVAVALAACGGARSTGFTLGAGPAAKRGTPGDDGTMCDWKGRVDREASETAGPGATLPNVRRVYQNIGTADDRRRVMVCREIDTNFDGRKDVVRFYNEKGEPTREEADTNFDGKLDTWTQFSSGRIVKETLDTDFDGQPDAWKFYTAGQLHLIQRDGNHDGKPDRWEYYVSGAVERIGIDLDYDGHVDRWDHDEIARKEAEAKAKADAQDPKDGGADGAAKGTPATAATAAPENPDDEADQDAGRKLVATAKRTLRDAGTKD
jgi:hypothetical protein